MLRRNCRRVIACGVLAVCLALAAPQATEAQVLQRQQIEEPEGRSELALWEKVWSAISSTWAQVSVMIDPEG